MTFTRPCGNLEPHEAHRYEHQWPQNDGPVTYRCRGMVEDHLTSFLREEQS